MHSSGQKQEEKACPCQKEGVSIDESEQEIPERFNLAEWVLEYKKREKIKE